MPEVEHSAEVAAPLSLVWDFVKDMDNWAPLLNGYQKHEKLDSNESLWFVKGELGGMTRVAEFRVRITEWAGPERVTFSLEGLQEPVNGTGEFIASSLVATSVPVMPAPAPRGLARLWNHLLRRILGRIFANSAQPVGEISAAPKLSLVTFKLNVQAGGALGPVLNIMLAPVLKPVVQDLADRIARSVEAKATGHQTLQG